MKKVDSAFNLLSLDIISVQKIKTKQEEFYDVELVGDDCESVPAHKLVLFAESEFCRQRLTKKTTALCLQGVNSKDINNILRFIYNGNVEVRNDEVEGFFEIGRKLKISGVDFDAEEGSDQENGNEENDTSSENTNEDTDAEDAPPQKPEKNQESKKRDQQDACKKSEKFTDQKVSSEQETRENKNVVDKVEAPPLISKSVAAASEPKPKTCSTTKTEETDAKKSEKFTDQKVSAGQETREYKHVVNKTVAPPLNSKSVAAASEPKPKTCSTTKTEETDAKKS